MTPRQPSQPHRSLADAGVRAALASRDFDAIDSKIVALVSAHGRISHEEIARRAHVSRPAVHERVKRLAPGRPLARPAALPVRSSVGGSRKSGGTRHPSLSVRCGRPAAT
ncbi:AsnC family transcriptional regulator [Micromonospora sp. U56]|uniref:AsnC family transcriptional regulator n=1 Tax=Micromonospora sp. U56 TaxID=2824900 RepID=UPI001B379E02|nr:AsnC family transcriptional regulator [Micromonospora sp. U56]